MADYTEHFSVVLPLKRRGDKRKRAWWTRAQEALLLNAGFSARDVGDSLHAFLAELQLPEYAQLTRVCDITVGEDCVLLTDDAGVTQTDGLGAVLQAYLKKFDPEGVIAVEIAFTCSKPRPDGFGGCAMLVTENHVAYRTLRNCIEVMRWELGVLSKEVRNKR